MRSFTLLTILLRSQITKKIESIRTAGYDHGDSKWKKKKDGKIHYNGNPKSYPSNVFPRASP